MVSTISIAAVLIYGVLLGNYITTAYHRIPNNKPINGIFRAYGMKPHCSQCGRTLKFWEYFPILSWFSARFFCNYCGKRVTPIYLALEVSTMLTALALYFTRGLDVSYGFLMLFIAALLLNFVLLVSYKRIYAKSLFCLLLAVIMNYALYYYSR